MAIITNFSAKANLYRTLNRPAVDRLFSIKQEYLENAEKATYYPDKTKWFGQAALRDTKARELWDKICAYAETLGEPIISVEQIKEFAKNATPDTITCGLRSNLNFTWWYTWMSNFA